MPEQGVVLVPHSEQPWLPLVGVRALQCVANACLRWRGGRKGLRHLLLLLLLLGRMLVSLVSFLRAVRQLLLPSVDVGLRGGRRCAS